MPNYLNSSQPPTNTLKVTSQLSKETLETAAVKFVKASCIVRALEQHNYSPYGLRCNTVRGNTIFSLGSTIYTFLSNTF